MRKTLPANEAKERVCIFVTASEIARLQAISQGTGGGDFKAMKAELDLLDAISERVVFSYNTGKTLERQRAIETPSANDQPSTKKEK
jgi:hypothetical protein